MNFYFISISSVKHIASHCECSLTTTTRYYSPTKPAPNRMADRMASAIKHRNMPAKKQAINIIESWNDSCDGIRSTFSARPVCTSTFWRYSSTAASISVDESLLPPSSLLPLNTDSRRISLSPHCCCWFILSAPVGGVIVKVDVVFCSSSSNMMVLRGDGCGEPNKSHSLSNSSVRGCLRWRGFFCIDRMIRREISPTLIDDKFGCDSFRIEDEPIDWRNVVAAGFNWLYPSEVSSGMTFVHHEYMNSSK